MSASNEKKNRQETAGAGFAETKTAREAKQRKEEKRSNIMYAVIAIAFVVVAVVTLTWKSGIVQRKATAATINGQNYTSAEVDYYYKTVYQNFVNNYSSYLSYFGLDTSKSLKSQSCPMDENGGTWYDYFMDQALTQMSSVHALNDAAAADGYTWNDDMQSQLDTQLESLKSSVEAYNTNYKANVSEGAYLKLLYGSIMTKGVYEEQMRLSIMAQSYSNDYVDSLTYTTSELTDAYNEDPNSYDVVNYESVQIDGSVKTDDTAAGDAASSAASSEAAEPTDEEKAAALENAKSIADTMLAAYKDGESLSDLADGNDLATYTDGQDGTYSDSVLMNWLFDDSRKAGDSAVLADEANSTYYVVTFGDRSRQNYETVDVRHILIKPEATTLAEDDEGYADDVAEKKAAAEKKANDLLAQWKSGAATEDSFADLANENSDDTGSNTKGGLYEQIYKGQMVAEFSDWCFDSARKSGDTGVVYSESTGYHVLYFVGTDLPYWQVQVTNSLKNNDYSDWYTSKTESYKAEQHSFGMGFIAA